MSDAPSVQPKPQAAKTKHGADRTEERQPWELYALVGCLIGQASLVLLGNQPYVSAWLLALLALGVGQALLLPSTAAWLGVLATVVLWVLFRQAIGTWSSRMLTQSMLEVAGLGLNVVLAIRHRQIWHRQQLELQELRLLRQVLVAGEAGTGMLPREVGELRLREEIDRARLFRRPLGLLLVEFEPLSESSADGVEVPATYQAIARRIGSIALVHDIPFRATPNCIGVILPERDYSRLYADAEAIVSALQDASFLNRQGQSASIEQYANLRFGLGTYQGEDGAVDLMRAAVDSLNISRDLAEIGAVRLSAYAMPATPIEQSAPVVSTEEE